MAKIVTETVLISISKMVKDSDAADSQIVAEEFIQNIEAVAQDMLSDTTALVEVFRVPQDN